MDGYVRPWLSHEHFQLTVQLIQEHAMFLLDPNGIVRTWNAGAERITGYKADEIVGQHFARLRTDEDVRSSKPDLVLRIAAARGRYEEEGWRLRHDGGPFWASVSITALHDENQRLVGFAKVTSDLGASRLTQSEPESSGILDAFLEHTPWPVVVTDIRGVAFLATAAASDLFGVRPDFFKGRPLINVIARQDTRAFRALLDELGEAPVGQLRTQKIRMRARTGGVFVVDVRVARFNGPRAPALHWTLRPSDTRWADLDQRGS
jgi:PAS domain S-box-containing protein